MGLITNQLTVKIINTNHQVFTKVSGTYITYLSNKKHTEQRSRQYKSNILFLLVKNPI